MDKEKKQALTALVQHPSSRLGAPRGELCCYGAADPAFFAAYTTENGFTNGRLTDEALEYLYEEALKRPAGDYPRLLIYLKHDESRWSSDEKPRFFAEMLDEEQRKLLLRLMGGAIKGRHSEADHRQLMKYREKRPFFDDEPDEALYCLTLVALRA